MLLDTKREEDSHTISFWPPEYLVCRLTGGDERVNMNEEGEAQQLYSA
jgi:hypothetical protein